MENNTAIIEFDSCDFLVRDSIIEAIKRSNNNLNIKHDQSIIDETMLYSKYNEEALLITDGRIYDDIEANSNEVDSDISNAVMLDNAIVDFTLKDEVIDMVCKIKDGKGAVDVYGIGRYYGLGAAIRVFLNTERDYIVKNIKDFNDIIKDFIKTIDVSYEFDILKPTEKEKKSEQEYLMEYISTFHHDIYFSDYYENPELFISLTYEDESDIEIVLYNKINGDV